MSKGTKAIVTMVGRMGDDINVRQNNGRKIGSLRLAVTDGFGEHETTSWFDVVVFDEKKVEVLEKYTAKGSRVMVTGILRVRQWTDKNDNKRYTTEVVVNFEGSVELMDSKDERPDKGSSRPPARAAAPAFDTDFDNDVPF